MPHRALALVALACCSACTESPTAPTSEPETSNAGSTVPAVGFDLAGAVAFARTEDGALFKVLADGTVAAASDARVWQYIALSGGGLAATTLDADGATDQDVLVRDGQITVLDEDVLGYPVGQTDRGDVYFAHGFVVPSGGSEPESVPLTGSSPYIASVSRNLVVGLSDLGSASLREVLDTSSGHLTRIDSCNNGEVVALSDERALVDDCGADELLVLSTGERSDAGMSGWNGEAIPVPDGAVFTSSTCPGGTSGYQLCRMAPTTEVEALYTGELNPLDTYGLQPTLIGDDRYFAVLERDGLVGFEAGIDEKWPTADNALVFQASMGSDHVAYYVGASGGRTVLGRVDLSTREVTVLDDARDYAEVVAAR
ncbi:MAG: hypothetical protein ABMB14_33095 [Myxococcota bacterium]